MAITRRSLLAWAGGLHVLAEGTEAAQLPPAQQRTQMSQLPVGGLLKPGPDAPAFARRKWSMQYFHDKERESLTLGTLQYSSPMRGIATAVRFRDGSLKGNLAMRTTDGGKTWLETDIGRRPYSLHVFDDSNAWIVCDNRLLYSDEGGAKWQRLKLPDQKMLRVHFQSPTRGWAFGIGNVFHETSDGGRSWKPVKESVELKFNTDNTIYSWMEFVTPKQGMATATSRRRMEWNGYLPDWMVPERSTRRRLMPGVIFNMVTGDGGATWKPVTTSAFGDLMKVRLRGMRGVSLISYDDGFDWPSEVNGLNLRTGGTEPIFRHRQIHVTDIALVGEAGILLAGIEALGRLRMSSLSGRVKAIYSPNGAEWYDMKVDYRAEGTFVRIARWGDDQFWLASNAGMMLKLGE